MFSFFITPRVGLEPTTLRLTAECSTAELSRNTLILQHFLHFFQVLFENTFMYLQNHIQSFISPSISFLSYHFKLTFRGNHSRTSFSHCPFGNKWTRIPVRSAPDASILPVSSTHAFPLLACLLRLCPRPISNSQLHALLHFHLCPIYLVVFKGSYYFRRDISS